MNEPKPFASLSPSLLARKGGARPAMRPQYQAYAPAAPQFHEATARQVEDDLGWNDMGHEEPVAPKTDAPETDVVVPLKPSAPLAPPKPVASIPAVARVPEVVRRQVEIAERIAEPPSKAVERVVEKAADPARRSALSDGRRAAFTLRLDAERHLKLRLACTIANRSAQQVVTDALDQFIANLPDVAELAAQVRKRS